MDTSTIFQHYKNKIGILAYSLTKKGINLECGDFLKIMILLCVGVEILICILPERLLHILFLTLATVFFVLYLCLSIVYKPQEIDRDAPVTEKGLDDLRAELGDEIEDIKDK